MLDDCIGDEVEAKAKGLKEGEVLLLENVRFHPEEEKNDAAFAKKLASLGEVFVNDAFGSCHRAHASVEGVTKHLPAVAGFLLEKEIAYFEKILRSPAKPFSLILGGAKVSDKIAVIENMLDMVDFLFIGGAMAYTFLRSRLMGTGASKVEEDKIDVASKIFEEAAKKQTSIILPEDHMVADKIADNAKVIYIDDFSIPKDLIGLDIGPKSVEKFTSILKGSKTVVWNGPVGFFELPSFSKGTEQIAKFVAGMDATTVIGGGDTAAAVKQLGLEDKFSHVSTGGGASLEYMEGKVLPGVAALQDKHIACNV
jgi:phosphoglycerate kinase